MTELVLIGYVSCLADGSTLDMFNCEPGERLTPEAARRDALLDVKRYTLHHHVRPVYVGAPLPEENTP